jgi:hypothetical protein
LSPGIGTVPRTGRGVDFTGGLATGLGAGFCWAREGVTIRAGKNIKAKRIAGYCGRYTIGT